MGEGVYIEGVYNRQVSASREAINQRRRDRNTREADELEQQGYTVERDLHPNGAYFAQIGNHPDHERELGKIFAENGLTFTLDREGNVKIKLPNGRTLKLPSSDGRVEGYTHEIYAFTKNPTNGQDPNEYFKRKVVDAITHSFKEFVPDRTRSIQSEVAISIAASGSRIRRSNIAEGVKEYKRQLSEGQTRAKPKVYLHVNEATRKIYYWSIK